ncbi:hypothetical protein NDU88_006216 [Pleurodeles waltl]|uniref:Uncharacterized protein n=1 Tax=Pleurodeles waltl TaxID=8319 RepID=A0AAV7SNV7_PLEWA|nr:hypothetical protein NDU88_006216 [Pleurodeles waltl]
MCNACVLLVKRWKKLPKETQKTWKHVVDARAGYNPKTAVRRKKRTVSCCRMKFHHIRKLKQKLNRRNSDAHSSTSSVSPAQSPCYSNHSDDCSDMERRPCDRAGRTQILSRKTEQLREGGGGSTRRPGTGTGLGDSRTRARRERTPRCPAATKRHCNSEVRTGSWCPGPWDAALEKRGAPQEEVEAALRPREPRLDPEPRDKAARRREAARADGAYVTAQTALGGWEPEQGGWEGGSGNLVPCNGEAALRPRRPHQKLVPWDVALEERGAP